MAIRLKSKNELNYVAILVISILGVVAFTSTAWSGWLIHEALTYEPATADGTIDAAVVALIGQMVSIATLTIGGLTAMLTSTGPKPAPPPTVTSSTGQESVATTVINDTDTPVPTDPQPPIVPDGDIPEDQPADEFPEEPEPEPEPEPVRRPRKRT